MTKYFKWACGQIIPDCSGHLEVHKQFCGALKAARKKRRRQKTARTLRDSIAAACLLFVLPLLAHGQELQYWKHFNQASKQQEPVRIKNTGKASSIAPLSSPQFTWSACVECIAPKILLRVNEKGELQLGEDVTWEQAAKELYRQMKEQGERHYKEQQETVKEIERIIQLLNPPVPSVRPKHLKLQVSTGGSGASRYDWSFVKDPKFYAGVGLSFGVTAYDISTSHGHEATRLLRGANGELSKAKYYGITAITNAGFLPLDLQPNHKWRYVSLFGRVGLALWRWNGARRNR